MNCVLYKCFEELLVNDGQYTEYSNAATVNRPNGNKSDEFRSQTLWS